MLIVPAESYRDGKYQINCFETAVRLAEMIIKENSYRDQADGGK